MRYPLLPLIAVLFLGACSKGSEPAPPVVVTPPAAPITKTHTVSLRYSLRSNGTADQLPSTPPSVAVYYQVLTPKAAGGYSISTRKLAVNMCDTDTNVKQVALPAITTYSNSGSVKPCAQVYISVNQRPPVGPNLGYTVVADLLIDDVVYPGTTYSGIQSAIAFNALYSVGIIDINH